MEGVRLVWAWEIRERETQSSVLWSKARLMYQTAVGGSEWCLSLEIFALLCHRTKLLAHPHSPHHLVELFVGSQSCYRIIFGAETGVFARVWCLVFQSQFPADQSLSVVLEGAEWHFSKSLFAFPTLHMNGSPGQLVVSTARLDTPRDFYHQTLRSGHTAERPDITRVR